MTDGNRLIGTKNPARKLRGRKRSRDARRNTRLGMENLEERALLAVFTVTNTMDAGAGSLRQAILDANAMAGPDDIEFDIAGAGPHTIQPTSALPDIIDTIDIDGFTQPGSVGNTAGVSEPSNATYQIEIDGSLAGAANGLDVAADNSIITGLVINQFALNGIRLTSNASTISNNFIGTDVAGQTALGNALDGVQILNSSGNEVSGNLLSGNLRDGLFVFLPEASNNSIVGNFVGTNRDGTVDLGNAACGIEIVGGSGNTVSDNLISGNDGHGVRIGSEGAGFNDVFRNRIGTDTTGAMDIGNSLAGVEIENSFRTDIGENTIAFNAGQGVNVLGDTAVGNRITRNSMFSNADIGGAEKSPAGTSWPTPFVLRRH
jgi:parallel beta-helix repeat protein